MKQIKSLKVIEVPADGKPTWWGGAYSHYFMYTKFKGNFILKGYNKEIEKWIKDNKITHYFVNKTFFGRTDKYEIFIGKKHHRSYWGFWKDGVIVIEPRKLGRSWCSNYSVREYGGIYPFDDSKKEKKEFKFKRMPKRWIPEFDQF